VYDEADGRNEQNLGWREQGGILDEPDELDGYQCTIRKPFLAFVADVDYHSSVGELTSGALDNLLLPRN
jgi:hypothetical protein